MTTSMGGYQGMQGPSGRTGNKIPTGYKQGQLQQFTPEQMQLFGSNFGLVGDNSQLRGLAAGDQQQFDQLEAPALRQFNQLQGNLASRFSGGSGAGSLGQRKSSGFQQAGNQAAMDFSQNLQAQRMGLQRQAIQDLMGISNDLLGQRPYEQFLIEKQQNNNGWGKLAGAALGGVGGYFAGNPIAGAKLGAEIGGAF